jgi:YD repeat-containing protein
MADINVTPLFQGNPSECTEVFEYNSEGRVSTITRTDREGKQWKQTFTYTDGRVSNITPWVKV